MKTIKTLFPLLLLMIAVAGISTSCQKKQESRMVLLVIFDGLRPDYITPEIMPNTYRLKTEGAFVAKHHSIFPTLTRVNSAGIASGAYPGTNGVLGNGVYFPSIDSAKGLNTGDAAELQRIIEATNGQLYTSPTLAETLRDGGKNLMVFSTGSTGQSFLLNHIADAFGAIVNPKLILPQSFQGELETTVGPIPSDENNGLLSHTWITDAYLHYGLAENAPEVSILWFTDPDATAHAKGIGAPETLASITYADNELGRVLKAIKERGLDKKVDILISTDHGFVTYIGSNNVAQFLIEKGLKESSGSTDVVVVGGAIYVKEKDKVEALTNVLMEQEWIGAVFSKPSGTDSVAGIVPGTFSMELARYNHAERSPDILIDMAWNDGVNEFGYPGMSHSRGIAGHGSSSPYELGINLIAYGPSFKKRFESNLATGNVDLAPTILQLTGLKAPREMDGRILHELLSNTKGEIKSSDITVLKVSNLIKEQELHMLTIGEYHYLKLTRSSFMKE
jgi:arylsulfatase A-like enzyme